MLCTTCSFITTEPAILSSRTQPDRSEDIIPALMALTSGTRLGPYEIAGPLGASGMGEVYRSKDMRLGRDVAIKVLPESLVRDSERLQRFEQEAQAMIAQALKHDGPALVEVIVSRRELSMPPTITLEQMKGFSLFMLRAVLSGRGDEIVDLAKINIFC